MGLLEFPLQVTKMVMRVIAMQVFFVFGLVTSFWVNALKPALKPLLDIGNNFKSEDLTVPKVTELGVKFAMSVFLLWWKSVYGVLQAISLPFQFLIEQAKSFLDLDKDKSGTKYTEDDETR